MTVRRSVLQQRQPRLQSQLHVMHVRKAEKCCNALVTLSALMEHKRRGWCPRWCSAAFSVLISKQPWHHRFVDSNL
jgi:hypothetical protein